MAERSRRLTQLVLSVAVATAACGRSEAPQTAAADVPADGPVPTVYWLDIWEGSVYRATGPDFTDDERLVHPTDTAPDGVAADVRGGKLYWTNMGDLYGLDGGTLQRSDLDGTDVERVVDAGVTHTPKQLQLDVLHGHMYWCDRGAAKVWRAGLDGTEPEVVVAGHGLEEPVGVALDVPAGKLYFGDRATGKIFRVGIDLPPGQRAVDRTDVELLHALPEGAMPIDLGVDPDDRHLYWTDRALGTVQRSGLDVPAGQDAATRNDVETLATDLHQPIGITLDVANDKLCFAEHGDPLSSIPGTVNEADLDGSGAREIARGNVITGVTLVHVPVS